MSGSERRGLVRLVSRDSLTFLGGWSLIIYQGTIADPFNWVVFAGGLIVVTAPGAAAAWAMRMSGAAPIAPSSSDSPQQVSPQP